MIAAVADKEAFDIVVAAYEGAYSFAAAAAVVESG